MTPAAAAESDLPQRLGGLESADSAPRPILSTLDVVALVVGVVVGAGIFRLPSLVAGNVADGRQFLLVWLAGGALSIIGGLCYVELAAAYPSRSGEYHFLECAFGRRVAFVYAWARLAVIQTGSIAALAFIVGDYAAELVGAQASAPAVLAAACIVFFTGLNTAGLQPGTWAQRLLSAAKTIGLLAVVAAGLGFAVRAPGLAAAPSAARPGMAMVFVLFTFGGWNEAAYVSAELRDRRHGMARGLLLGLVLITGLYLAVNLAYLRVLGLEGVAHSKAVAVDLVRQVAGGQAALLVGVLVALAAAGALQATVFTGARSVQALGVSGTPLAALGHWNGRTDSPRHALVTQGLVALALVWLGALSRHGFETAIDYTAPVFWFFFVLIGLALFRLRHTHPLTSRPFQVPGYPVTPLVFVLCSLYMLYSSVRYAGPGTLAGICVVAVGGALALWLSAAPQPQDRV